MDKTKSNAFWERARQSLPGGLRTNFKQEEGAKATYFANGKGGRLYDIDGNEYIDFEASRGPAILGHSNPALIKTIKEYAEKYTNEDCELPTLLAEKIKEHNPACELVRFATAGTDANQYALRAARAYTGKDKFVRFNGHYNGSRDNVLGGIVKDPSNPVPVAGEFDNDVFTIMTDTAGRASTALSECYLIEWNDLNALEKLLKDRGDNIAAVLMEPVMTNFTGAVAEPGYMEGVRALCDQYNVVLIFDEVLTGFRIAIGGAAEFYNIKPDIQTFAKALGGGFPIAAYGGKKEVMDVFTSGKAMGGGTYSGHPIAMAASLTTISELEKNNCEAYKIMNKNGNRFKNGVIEINDRLGTDLLLQGYPGAWTPNWTKKSKIINWADSLRNSNIEAEFKICSIMKQNGLINNHRFCITPAHTEEDIEEALRIVEKSLVEFKKYI